VGATPNIVTNGDGNPDRTSHAINAAPPLARPASPADQGDDTHVLAQ
jgi:hypothetical protein